jgi:hypothetical protein
VFSCISPILRRHFQRTNISYICSDSDELGVQTDLPIKNYNTRKAKTGLSRGVDFQDSAFFSFYSERNETFDKSFL